MMRNKSPRPVQPPVDEASTTNKPARDFESLLPHAAVALGLFTLVFLAWSNSFGGAFVLDSKFLMLQDPRVHQWNATNVNLILNRPYWWSPVNSGLYRPFTTLTYLFNYAILGNGEHPAGYHWVNLLLHSFNAFLVYLLALRLLRRRWPAVFIAAVWAVHPVLTESVTNIVGRADLLACLAILSGLLMYLKSTESAGLRKAAWLLGLMAVTTLGVFSKESGVVILGLIVLYEITWWKERRQVRGLAYGCVATGVPILAMLYRRSLVMAAAGPMVVLFTDNPLTNASFVQSRLTAVSVIAKCLWLLVWPVKLSSDYSYNQIPLATGAPHDWIAWIVVLAVTIAAIAMFKKPVAFFFAGFAFLAFLPVSNLLFLIGAPMAERFLYVPAIGFAGCLVLAAFWAGERIHWPQFAPLILCLLVIAAGIRTWERNLDWHDDVSLWTSAAAAAPNSFKVHDNLSGALEESDPEHLNIDRAIQEGEKSIAVLNSLPDSLSTPLPYADAGQRYLTKGDLLAGHGPDGQSTATAGSLSAYERSLAILLRGVEIDRAVNESNRRKELARGIPASEIGTIGSPQMYYGIAMCYLRLGRNQDAYDAASYVRMLAPRYIGAYEVMGEALIAANRREDAAVELLEGLVVSRGDKGLMPLLQQAYNRSLDPNNCAFMQDASGASLNGRCEIVHKDLCEASARIIKNALEEQHAGLAGQMRNQAVTQFGCSAGELAAGQLEHH
jgi:protein O-mannosyl-transferase